MNRINKWKDRGWWVSVEIDNRTSARKNENLVRDLLDQAQERYDLHLDGGQTLSRGIFTAEADMQDLSKLLDLSKTWKRTRIYANGNLLETNRTGRLSTLLVCAGTHGGCRSGNNDRQLAFLGCHRLRIGLMNYSLASLKKGERYWFSYLKSDKEDHLHAYLDKSRLENDMASSRLCPLFPDRTESMIETLPPRVSLKPINHQLFWVPTARKIRTSWLCRHPPVVPCSAELYRSWLEKLLASPT